MKAKIDKKEFYQWWRKFRLKASKAKKSNSIVARALSNAAELVLTRSKTYYLTGAALRVRTGRLRSSVTKAPKTGSFRRGNKYWVEVGTSVWYGAAWEMGFTIPSYVIRPKNKKALRFIKDGKEIFAKRVVIPARTEKPRKWLEPAIKDEEPRIMQLLERAGIQVWQ